MESNQVHKIQIIKARIWKRNSQLNFNIIISVLRPEKKINLLPKQSESIIKMKNRRRKPWLKMIYKVSDSIYSTFINRGTINTDYKVIYFILLFKILTPNRFYYPKKWMILFRIISQVKQKLSNHLNKLFRVSQVYF